MRLGCFIALGTALLVVTLCSVQAVLELPYKSDRWMEQPAPPHLGEMVLEGLPAGRELFRAEMCLREETVDLDGETWQVMNVSPAPSTKEVLVLGRGVLPEERCSTLHVRYEGVKGKWHTFFIIGEWNWGIPTRRLQWR